MKFKEAFVFILSDIKKKFVIYYGIVLLVSIFFIIMSLFGANGSITNFDIMSYFVMSMLMMITYKTSRKMLNVNGISRNTHFVAELSVIGVISLAISIIENLFGLLMSNIKNIEYATLYTTIFQKNLTTPTYFFQSMLLDFIICLTFMAVISFIGKLADKIGTIPFLTIFFILFFGFMIFVPLLTNMSIAFNNFAASLLKFIINILSIETGQPYKFELLLIIIFIALNCICYLIMRKTALKAKE